MGLSTVGSIAVVGCLGTSQRFSIGVGSANTRSYQAAHALAVAADRHSDELSVRVESVGPPSHRLYSVDDGTVDAVGVDNTILYRASENRGVFDLDPIDVLPHQGFAYGHREYYWLAVEAEQSTPDSTAEFADRVVHPGQPGDPSRLVAEQLLRDADLWQAIDIDNHPYTEVPAAVEQRTISCLLATQHNRQTLAEWSQAVDDRVGDRLAVVPTGSSFQTAIDDAPNTVGRSIEPVGWDNGALDEAVDGWAVPMQWLHSPSADPDAVAELTRIAHDHGRTLREVDPLAVEGSPDRLTESVINGLAVHEGTAKVFSERESWNSDWTVGNAVD